MSVELSVILCTHNGASTIAAQLDAVLEQCPSASWELVVVDNRSTDDTIAVVRRHAHPGAPLRVVSADERSGLAYARNAGVASAEGSLLAFCDDDDVVGDGWIDAIARAVRAHRFVGSRMEYGRLNSAEVMRGRAQFQTSELPSMFGFPIVNGAGFAIERMLWDRVGGNDESLTDTGEDADFAIRVQLETGVNPVLATDAVYHYRQREGARRAFGQAAAYGRAHVMLYDRYGRDRADVRRERQRAAHDWWWITTRAAVAPFRPRRTSWARRAGLRIGRLQGSARHRVWFP